MPEHFLVTGAMGCIGAWAVHNLIHQGAAVTVFDLSSDPRRLKLILTPAELERVNFVAGDITDLSDLEHALDDNAITHLIHLAALQVPFCKADPPLGARVNVVGTVNVFEAVKKRRHISKVVYASSAAVYDVADAYPKDTPIPHDAHLKPNTLYGVYKQANEGSARVYWQDEGVSSLGLRPYVVYGVGRDQGMTSTPTKAIFAAALGQPYHISYGGRCDFEYAPDAANAFIAAARSPFTGMDVLNLTGTVAHMQQVVNAIESAAPEMKGQITFEEKGLPFPEEMDAQPLTQALGQLPVTPLTEGVAETLNRFRTLIQQGALKKTDMLS